MALRSQKHAFQEHDPLRVRPKLEKAASIVSAPQPRQSEICVKFSVFHTVFDVTFW